MGVRSLRLYRSLSVLAAWGLLAVSAWADTGAATTTLTIDPAAVSGATITSSDENNRNGDVSTHSNAHVHSLGNTTNFGDGTAGHKSLCADAADSTDACIRWNDTNNLWTIDNPTPGTFNQIATFSGTGGLTAGNLVVADGTGSLVGRTVGRSLTGSSTAIDADAELYTDVKTININASHAETNWFMWRPPHNITITGIDCIVEAGTSVVLTLRECDGNGANCSDIEAAITCLTTNTTESGAIDNASVDAGDWIRVTRGTVTGTLDQAVISFEYTKDD